MNKKTLLNFWLLLLCMIVGGASSAWGDTTYKLTQVTSVSAGNKYVFVRKSKALSNSVSSSALQTTDSYSTTGLLGTEAYVWTLESATGGFYLKNVSLKSSQYLSNSSGTSVSFGSKSSIWTVGFTNGVALIQNTSNSNRFLGETTSSSNQYKAYATSNLSTYGHDFTVYILEEEVGVTSLSVNTEPTKTRYEVGESLDMTGFVLDADGTLKDSGYTMTMGGSSITNGATLSSVGKKTITVSYGGKTVEQAISVGAVTGISVTTPPTNTSYDTGDSFDPTGMEVTADLSTGEPSEPDTWTKTVTGYTVSPEDNLAPANTYVTITYAGKTATQAITVTNVAVTGVSVKASTTIEKTKTETLTPTITPANATDKSVTWESDNPDVATVSAAGVVTAEAVGTANITVTTVDGGETATCVVKVVNKKGSIDAPYSVADVIAIRPDSKDVAAESDVYVKGYIVGGFNTSSNFTTTSSEFQVSNLALADDYNETTGSKTIPVELKNGTTIRTNYNPQDNTYKVGVAQVLIKADVIKYFGVPGLKSLDEMSTVAEAVTVTNVGFGTWASDNGLDFSGLGVKAYRATIDGTNISFTKVTEVPAGEGVLLQNEGTFVVPVKSVSAWDDDDNAFVRGTGDAVATGTGPYNYILNNVDDVVGFYKANGKKVAKNRAYLQSETYAARISLNLDDDQTTGIRNLTSTISEGDGAIYNLRGQRVENPSKGGLYIMNGKKVIFK